VKKSEKSNSTVVTVVTRLGEGRDLQFNTPAEAGIVISMLGGGTSVTIGQNNHVSLPVAHMAYKTLSGVNAKPVLSPTIPVTGCAIVHRVDGNQIDNYRYDNLVITESIIKNYWLYGPMDVAKKMTCGMTFQSLIDKVGYEKFSRARSKVAKHVIRDRFDNLDIPASHTNTFLRNVGM
jgi:hypothetical protein